MHLILTEEDLQQAVAEFITRRRLVPKPFTTIINIDMHVDDSDFHSDRVEAVVLLMEPEA
jgi:hypothetical protein